MGAGFLTQADELRGWYLLDVLLMAQVLEGLYKQIVGGVAGGALAGVSALGFAPCKHLRKRDNVPSH